MKHHIDFTTTDYLKTGSDRQKLIFGVLQRNQIFEILSKFNPVLAGTFPIEIDIPGSDLDILCCCSNPNDLIEY